MTLMKLNFLEWEKRLCAGIAKINYLWVARVEREVAQVIYGDIQKVAYKEATVVYRKEATYHPLLAF